MAADVIETLHLQLHSAAALPFVLRQTFHQQDFGFADRLMFRMQVGAKLVKAFLDLQGMDDEAGTDHGEAVGLIVASRRLFPLQSRDR
jgi:hypothetical protein